MSEPTRDEVRDIVQSMQNCAVLGAHQIPTRPAHYVPQAVYDGGVPITPVNKRFAGNTLWGATVLSRLDEIEHEVHVVDVFRRADVLPTHLEDILGMRHKPRVVWLQSGIRNDEFAQTLRSEGIVVVQDRCLMVDFRAMR